MPPDFHVRLNTYQITDVFQSELDSLGEGKIDFLNSKFITENF